MDLDNVEFRDGILEQLPVDDGWADVVIANGVLNLVADKVAVLREALRALRPGGVILGEQLTGVLAAAGLRIPPSHA